MHVLSCIRWICWCNFISVQLLGHILCAFNEYRDPIPYGHQVWSCLQTRGNASQNGFLNTSFERKLQSRAHLESLREISHACRFNGAASEYGPICTVICNFQIHAIRQVIYESTRTSLILQRRDLFCSRPGRILYMICINLFILLVQPSGC